MSKCLSGKSCVNKKATKNKVAPKVNMNQFLMETCLKNYVLNTSTQ